MIIVVILKTSSLRAKRRLVVVLDSFVVLTVI